MRKDKEENMNITISEERYKEMLKLEALIELYVDRVKEDGYVTKKSFLRLFDPNYKEEEE